MEMFNQLDCVPSDVSIYYKSKKWIEDEKHGRHAFGMHHNDIDLLIVYLYTEILRSISNEMRKV